ncbi:ester hydrolase C11orf54 homolog [Acropora muricata]|uniref:ester hydrolase C11orf54 homolog n=1 Tax=Acropora millepora TaxID=45264 RepID=UPI001CF236BF|nr:ester hydrolase C11orf54 homolog [Acropora millepora]
MSVTGNKTPKGLPVERKDLFVPPLSDLSQVLQEGLAKNFSTVEVTVVDCPDLREKPWTLAAPGICSRTRIADVGGPPYLIPLPDLSKFYSFSDIAESAELPGGFIIGAGAGSSKFVGVNCEMMANLVIRSEQKAEIATKIAKVNEENGSCVVENYNCGEFGLLGNFLISDGMPGKVLKVSASKRTGDKNLITCMRHTLANFYGEDKPVGLGGVFVIEKGKAKIHIMPRFSETPLKTDEDVNNWLRFYEMSAPLVCVGVLESHDPGLDLRIEHFHCFSDHGEGGHYHYDVTPDEVHYTGFFAVAEKIYRIDRPLATHHVGRD